MSEDILDRLKKWMKYKTGDMVSPANWGDLLHDDLKDAIAEIEMLRGCAGAVSAGPSFSEIKAEIKAEIAG